MGPIALVASRFSFQYTRTHTHGLHLEYGQKEIKSTDFTILTFSIQLFTIQLFLHLKKKKILECENNTNNGQ